MLDKNSCRSPNRVHRERGPCSDLRVDLVARFTLQLLAAWVVMTMTHEIGHLVGGWCGGAKLTNVDLVPWRLPYSLHNPDPMPRLTLWGSPILGVLLPLTVAALTRHRVAWFIADFCLIANGAYLALAWITGDRYLDTSRMLDAGISPFAIVAYCAVTISIGYVRFRADCIDVLKA